MTRAYSNDLRERVVAAVLRDGLSRHAAAARFGVAPSSAVKWVSRYQETGSVAPDQIGGHKPRTLRDAHRDWLLERMQRDFTLRGLVVELAERGVKVDYRQVWEFAHTEGLSFKKKACCPPNSCGQRSPGAASSGRNIRVGLIRRASSSSTRLGSKPIWRRCGGGRRWVNGSTPRRPMATGAR